MRHNCIARLTIVLFIVMMTAIPFHVQAQDSSEVKTFITPSGLVFDYPADWYVSEFLGLIWVRNNSEISLDPIQPGTVWLQILKLDDLQIDSELIQTDIDELVETAKTDPSYTMEEIEFSDHPGIRIDKKNEEIDAHELTIILEIDGQSIVISAFTYQTEFSQFEDAILAIVASMHIDQNAESSLVLPVDSEPTPGNGAVVWMQRGQFPEGLTGGYLIDMAVGSGDSIYMMDSALIYRFDEDGRFVGRMSPQGITRFFRITVAPDDTIWMATMKELVHLSADGTVLGSIDIYYGLSDVGVSTLQDFLIGSDGRLYILVHTIISDSEGLSEGYLYIWNPAGELYQAIPLEQLPNRMALTPENDFLLLAGQIFMRVDDSGTILDEILFNIAEQDFGEDFAVTHDGSLFITSVEGVIYHFDPAGVLVAELDLNTLDTGEHSQTNWSFDGTDHIAALSNGDVVAVAIDAQGWLLVRLDFDAVDLSLPVSAGDQP